MHRTASRTPLPGNVPSVLAVLLVLGAFCACSSGSDAAPEPSKAARPEPVPPGLRFAAQPGWVEEPATSSMRKAQFVLPRAEGDAADATLVVYYFGSDAGTIQANIGRWAGQFEQPDGRDSKAVLKSATRRVGNLSVTEVDLSGTYVAETPPGSGVRVREEGWRMLAAILEAPEGPYYAKLVGPQATVARWEPSFRAFVNEAATGE